MSRIDNLVKRLTDVYNTTVGSNIRKLLSPDADTYDDIYDMNSDLYDSHYVEYAFGESLESIGHMVGLVRQPGETDEQLRARILARVQGFLGGGTKASIANAVVEFLDIPESAVEILDGYLDSGAYGHIRVGINTNVTWNIGQEFGKLVALINTVKAAGIYVDSVGPFVGESINVTDSFGQTSGDVSTVETASMTDNEDLFDHITDITYTNSLNIVI